MKLDIAERYRVADRIQNAVLNGSLRNLLVIPHWIGASSAFWCERWQGGVREFIRIDAATGGIARSFDRDRVLPALADAVERSVQDLKIEGLRYSDVGTPEFKVERTWWSFDEAADTCSRVAEEAEASGPPNGLANPQGTLVAFVRNFNVWIRNCATGEERALTDDGVRDWSYGKDAATTGSPAVANGIRAAWSPDGTSLFTHRVDERGLVDVPLINSAPERGKPATVSFTRFAHPGAAEIARYELCFINAATGERAEVRHRGLAATRMEFSPFWTAMAWWRSDGAGAYFLEFERGDQRVTVWSVDVDTGEVRALFSEESETLLDIGWDINLAVGCRYLADSEQLLWMSQRSGRMHIYRYDLRTGECLNAVTEGEYVVRDILRVEDDAVIFSATGREPGWGIYDKAIYSAALSGNDIRLLTPDPADYDILVPDAFSRFVLATQPNLPWDGVGGFSPDGRFFVASSSRSGEPPRTLLFDRNGRSVVEVAVGECEPGLSVRWPLRFEVMAADERTQVAGKLFLPDGLDEGEQLPILDLVYMGPQVAIGAIAVPASPIGGAYWSMALGLAQLGFAVAIIDGRGLPFREKSFHDHSYRAIERTSDLDDHEHAIRQLRAQHPVLADGLVGAIGHSGGGFGATRAILTKPGFYGVAVASSGNHDQRLFGSGWGERFEGLPIDERWEAAANVTHAANLRGHLLLIHGEQDTGVHPAHTMQLVDALIKADRDFDLLLVPGAGHGLTRIPHVRRRSWDFLVRHLRRETPPAAPVAAAPQ